MTLPTGNHVAPSILAANHGRLRDQVKEMIDAGATVIHVDIMDGHFVPPLTSPVPAPTSSRSTPRRRPTSTTPWPRSATPARPLASPSARARRSTSSASSRAATTSRSA
jgi:hypothetical protein